MRNYIYLIALISFSCQHEEFENVLEPSLAGHYYTFLDEAMVRGYSLPDKAVMIIFTDDNSRRAVCYTTKRTATIKVSKTFYDYYMEVAPEQVEATIFHELGHGLLERGHQESGFSLMVVGSAREDYKERRSEYLNELFNYASN